MPNVLERDILTLLILTIELSSNLTYLLTTYKLIEIAWRSLTLKSIIMWGSRKNLAVADRFKYTLGIKWTKPSNTARMFLLWDNYARNRLLPRLLFRQNEPSQKLYDIYSWRVLKQPRGMVTTISYFRFFHPNSSSASTFPPFMRQLNRTKDWLLCLFQDLNSYSMALGPFDKRTLGKRCLECKQRHLKVSTLFAG